MHVLTLDALKRNIQNIFIFVEDYSNETVWKESRSLYPEISTTSLRNHYIKKTLPDLHQSHIVVLVDRASGNVFVICKSSYAWIVMKELSKSSNR